MGTAAPFVDEVAQLITQVHEQRLTVTLDLAGPTSLTLDVADHDIDWDETRTPRVQGYLDVPVPEDQATLNLIDPRTLVKVHLLAAYRLGSGEWDEHEVAVLYLRNRRVVRSPGSDVLRLIVASAESLFIDASGPNPTADGSSLFTQPSLTAAVRYYVTSLFAGTPLAAMPTDGADFTPPVDVPIAPHPWDALSDLAEQYDANIYDNGTARFTVAPRQLLAAETVLALSVGTNGTIMTSNTGISRDDWGNWVAVFYNWTDGAGISQWDGGAAHVLSGPFAVAAAGYKVVTVERNMWGSVTTGNRLAATILRRMLARSRSYTIQAVPAWWVRPESTITVQLPLGEQERHLVSRVGFRPGAMTIETRLPDTASVIGE